MKLAFIDIGNVGFALANNLEKKGLASSLPNYAPAQKA